VYLVSSYIRTGIVAIRLEKIKIPDKNLVLLLLSFFNKRKIKYIDNENAEKKVITGNALK
jgi:hypothetical protein